LGILCGIDIIEIDRIRQSMETTGEAFRDRVFTRREIAYCESKKGARYKSYAARFAAKEAVAKALGTGISQGIRWVDIEVLNHDSGKPYVVISGKAGKIFEEMGGRHISVSLSHCGDYAVAYAALQTE
jgi:holo-[acyl-carrier protein] synthase